MIRRRALFAFLALLTPWPFLAGCGQTPKERALRYEAESQACVVQSPTEDKARACWCEVRKRYDLPCEGDGGAP
jgi:hypothetical protein